MIEALDTKCLVLKNEESSNLIFDVFGEEWWNDSENIFCAPVACIEDNHMEKLEKAGLKNIKEYQFLICLHREWQI